MLIKINSSSLFPVNSQLPAILFPWISYQESITDRLHGKAGHTRLEVLRQVWELSNWWDQKVLDFDRNHRVFHREIVMWALEDACWYARTIIPDVTYQADQTFFSRLDKELLGKLIFNEPRVTRASQIYYPITQQSIEYNWLLEFMPNTATVLWARLSAFTFKNKYPFYLIEIFLPALERYSN